MRKPNSLLYFILAIILPLMHGACKKDTALPQLSKTTLKAVGPTFADIQGRVYVEGSSAIIQRGACWELKTSAGDSKAVQFPTIQGDTMHADGGTGLINLRVNGLQPDTAYYIRFFAVNGEGVQYSYPVLARTPPIPEGGVFVEGFLLGEGFEMGNLVGASDETPVHQVTLPNYFIGKKEITNAQYCTFLNKLDSAGQISREGIVGSLEYIDMDDDDVLIVYENNRFLPKMGYEDYPAVEVSWYGAKAYCNLFGYSLPTEASWEFAARGGLLSNKYSYAGSNNAGEVAWYNGNSGDMLHPAGQKQPNELGAYDMTGNVWEWCEDWYGDDYYASSSINDPTGPSSGDQKVLRGGSFAEEAYGNTKRHAQSPETTEANIGFRVRY
jgi:formylglycine-generating enzyme required for sulfatase activity